jgi:hypothetical protein
MSAYGGGGSRGRGRQSAAPAPTPIEQLPPGKGGAELRNLILRDDDRFQQTIYAQIQNERRREFKSRYPNFNRWDDTVHEGTGGYVKFSPPRNGLGRIYEIASSNMRHDKADPWVYLRAVSYVTGTFYREILQSRGTGRMRVLVALVSELLNEANRTGNELELITIQQGSSTGETARAYERLKLTGISDAATAGKIALDAVFDQEVGVPDADKQPFGPQLQTLWETIVRVPTFPATDAGLAQFAEEQKAIFYQALAAVTQAFPRFFPAPQVPTPRVEIQYDEPPTPLTNMFTEYSYAPEEGEPDQDGDPAAVAEFSETETLPYSSGDDLDQFAPGMPLPGPPRERRRFSSPSDSEDSSSRSSSSDSEGSFSPPEADDWPLYTEADSRELSEALKRMERHPNGSSSEDDGSSSEDDGQPPEKRQRTDAIRAALQLERGDTVKAAARLMKAMRIY